MGSMNPILAELDGLSPSAKQALLQAHQGASNPMQGTQSPNPALAALRQPAAPSGPEPPSPTIPPIGGGPSVPAIGTAHPNVIAPKGTLAGDQAERTRLMATGSGESQIYNKVTNSGFGQEHPLAGKILGGLGQGAAMIGDAAASSVMPQLTRAIPGTASHHQALLHSADTAVANDEANAGKEAATAHSQAEMPLIEAQTREANARAGSLENPPDKPDKFTFQQTDHGLMRIDSTTGEATPVTYQGQPLQPKPVPEKGIVTDLKVGGKEHNVLIDPTTGKQISDLGERGEKPVQGAGVTVVTPEGTIQRLAPGQSMEPGSMSPTQLGAQNASDVKESKADKKTALAAADDYKLMQTLAAQPSPTNDLAMVMHYIGATKPDSLGKLRLNQNEISLVMGTRSSFGDLEAMAQKVQNGQMLTPKQRSDMLATMKILSSKGDGAQPSAEMIRARDPQGNLHEAPKGTALPKGWTLQ